MAIELIGSLPVGSVNLGLAATPAGIQAEITKLTADVSKFTGAIDLKATVTSSFPPDPTFLVAMQSALDVSMLTEMFNPANWATLCADFNSDLTTEVGLVSAQLAIVEEITGTLQAGLDTGSLTGWTYAGRARGFGSTLKTATAGGFGGVDKSTTVGALIIGCASFSSWGSFSAGFETGTSDDEDLGETTTQERLQCQGTLTGGQWNTGALDIFARLDALRLRLAGTKLALELQLQLSLGVGLPDPGDLIDFGLTLDLDAALDNLVNIQTDLTAEIGGINAQIALLLALKGDIEAQLTAGGLSLWSYSGPAGQLGAEFATEIADGLPDAGGANSPAYGLCIACASPSAWAGFGEITATG